jgi:hypothetical protein
MQWLRTSKYTIFLILLKFQNLWNLINVLIQFFYETIYLNVINDFKKFNGFNKIKCDIPNGTTRRWVCPNVDSMTISLDLLLPISN